MHQSQKSIYLELGGSGIYGTLNYDWSINDTLWFRLGGTFLALSDSPLEWGWGGLFMPMALLGRDAARLELGAGLMVFVGEYLGDFFSTGNHLLAYPTASVGLRLQPRNRGLLFRLAFTPIFLERLVPWVGVSLGYSFR